MVDYDEDDLLDYREGSAEEDFNEDLLDDEEYNKLYKSLDSLKEKIATYNDEINDEELKQALYFNFYDVDEAFAEIKEKFPKKKQKGKSFFNFFWSYFNRQYILSSILGFHSNTRV